MSEGNTCYLYKIPGLRPQRGTNLSLFFRYTARFRKDCVFAEAARTSDELPHATAHLRGFPSNLFLLHWSRTEGPGEDPLKAGRLGLGREGREASLVAAPFASYQNAGGRSLLPPATPPLCSLHRPHLENALLNATLYRYRPHTTTVTRPTEKQNQPPAVL
ncbi:hypothetical protein BT69DRAFT_1337425 [Atractiella rhizophila]|nr:hypothetical protein BT69DRAFT_1337425 [Atractiella rhizophila]